MHALYAFLAAAIHLGTLAGAQKHPWSRHVARASPITTNKVYNIQDFYQGNDFFECVFASCRVLFDPYLSSVNGPSTLALIRRVEMSCTRVCRTPNPKVLP